MFLDVTYLMSADDQGVATLRRLCRWRAGHGHLPLPEAPPRSGGALMPSRRLLRRRQPRGGTGETSGPFFNEGLTRRSSRMRAPIAVAVTALGLTLQACAAGPQVSAPDQRSAIRQMASDTLAQLYQSYPGTQSRIRGGCGLRGVQRHRHEDVLRGRGPRRGHRGQQRHEAGHLHEDDRAAAGVRLRHREFPERVHIRHEGRVQRLWNSGLGVRCQRDGRGKERHRAAAPRAVSWCPPG